MPLTPPTPEETITFLQHSVQQLSGVLVMAGAPEHVQNTKHLADWAAGVKRSQERIDALSTALRDAISTYDEKRAETFVSAERQEAWIEVLKAHGTQA